MYTVLIMLKLRSQLYKFVDCLPNVRIKHQYHPDTSIYNQPSKVKKNYLGLLTQYKTRPPRHQSMKLMLSFMYHFKVTWADSSVGIETGYGLDGPGSNPGGDEIFRPSRPALRPT